MKAKSNLGLVYKTLTDGGHLAKMPTGYRLRDSFANPIRNFTDASIRPITGILTKNENGWLILDTNIVNDTDANTAIGRLIVQLKRQAFEAVRIRVEFLKKDRTATSLRRKMKRKFGRLLVNMGGKGSVREFALAFPYNGEKPVPPIQLVNQIFGKIDDRLVSLDPTTDLGLYCYAKISWNDVTYYLYNFSGKVAEAYL